jgi:Flp pilus assembly protein CpaB
MPESTPVDEPSRFECPLCHAAMGPAALVCPACGDNSKQIARSAEIRRDWLRGIGLLLVCLAAGVAAICAVYYVVEHLQAGEEGTQAQAPQPGSVPVHKVTLLVAKQELRRNTPLGNKPEDFFVEKQFIQNDAPKDALAPTDLPKLKGKFLKRVLAKGAPVTAEDLLDTPAFSMKAFAPNMDAVCLHVSYLESLAGQFSFEGCHVDIIWSGDDNDQDKTPVKLLLEDAVVLAMNMRDQPAHVGIPSFDVYVALSPEDALKATSLMKTGWLHMCPHNLADPSQPIVIQPQLDGKKLQGDSSGSVRRQ